MKKTLLVGILLLLSVAVYFSYDLLLYRVNRPLRANGKTVYFVPYRDAPSGEEELASPTSFVSRLQKKLAAQGYELKYSTLKRLPLDADYLIVINQRRRKSEALRVNAFPKERKVAFIFEPPIIEPKAFTPAFSNRFAAVYYSLINDLSGGENRYKFHYPHPLEPRAHWPDFGEKRLCTLVVGNKMSHFPNSLYQERRNAIDYFENHHPESFAFYGRGWSREEHPTYEGEPAWKLDAVSNFRFSICYENSVEPGNITEKIFDSFCAGCIPVYWGAPDITDWVPKDCFIDRTEFADLDALYAHLNGMEREEYEGYLSRIRAFLTSEQAAVRSIDRLLDTMVEAVIKMDQP